MKNTVNDDLVKRPSELEIEQHACLVCGEDESMKSSFTRAVWHTVWNLRSNSI